MNGNPCPQGQFDVDPAPRSLGEIVEDCWAGKALDSDELRLAVCALSVLLVRDEQALQKLATGELDCRAPMRDYSAVYQHEAYANRMGQALQGAPREYLGEGGDLDNPGLRARRQAQALLSRFMSRGIRP